RHRHRRQRCGPRRASVGERARGRLTRLRDRGQRHRRWRAGAWSAGSRARAPRDGPPARAHDPVRDPFPGACPHHGDCLEGLASAPALAARWRQAPETLPEDHPAWELQAHYLALGLANVILVLSPERVVIGGGVMARARLYPLIRAKLASLLGGYLQTPALGEGIDDYVVPPALADRAGVLGAIALSQAAVS